MPELFNNRYRIIRRLGRGGMAEVLLAEDTRNTGRLVAIKTYTVAPDSSTDFDLFEREFTLLASLAHPHINTVYDYGHIKEQKLFFFSAPFLNGVPLDDFAQSASFDEILTVTAQVLEALDYLHIKGILHFDIKPANIFVTRDPKTNQPDAKLLDMGISLFEREGTHRSGFGTPNYMAPEVILRREFDHRADLFSLGATLYKVVYKVPAFPGSQIQEVYKKVLTLDPEFPPTPKFPEAYLKIIQKLLNKHPDERFYSSTEILEALRNAFPEKLPKTKINPGRRLTKATSLIGRNVELRYLTSGPITFVTTDFEVRPQNQGVVMIRNGVAHSVATAVSIIGPEGVGKSRLLKEARILAQTALANTYTIDGKAAPDIFQLLEDIERILSAATTPEPQGSWEHSILKSLGSATQSTLVSFKDKVLAYAGQLIAKAKVNNLLILIDDFDGLTDTTKELILHLIGLSTFFLDKSGFRLGIIATSRSETLKGASVVELQNFSTENMTAEYLEKSLAVQKIPAWLTREIHAISKGNPRFIEELTSSLLDNNVIRIEKGFITFDGESIPKHLIPSEIEDSYRKRLSNIPPPCPRPP